MPQQKTFYLLMIKYQLPKSTLFRITIFFKHKLSKNYNYENCFCCEFNEGENKFPSDWVISLLFTIKKIETK